MFKIKNFITIIFFGFTFIETSNFFYLTSEAKNFEINVNKSSKISLDNEKINSKTSINKSVKNFKFFDNHSIIEKSKMFNYLANNLLIKNDNFAEINSDSQYRKDDKFYAEGNVIVYLSNAKLTADKLIYDTINKELTVEGKITFTKGNQYIEASLFNYNFIKEKGSASDVYAVLNFKSINEDFDINNNQNIEPSIKNEDISNIIFRGSSDFSIENTFEDNKDLNISSAEINVPEVIKWRLKSDKLLIEKDTLNSKKVIFTNDPFNRPQFLVESNNFTAEIKEDKLRMISKNTWLKFDDKVSFPIGRRNVIDRDVLTRWNIGSDYSDKDGFYISRSFYKKNILDNFVLETTPYFLIQRSINGYTKSFTAEDSSIISENVKRETVFLDNFALENRLFGEVDNWNIVLNTQLNSLDLDKVSESSRAKLKINRSINLNQKNTFDSSNLNNSNSLDINLYSAYRNKVDKVISGEAEIYLANGITFANNRIWRFNDNTINSKISYDIGNFNSELKGIKELKTLTRNAIEADLGYKFPIFKKNNLDKKINSEYKYTPIVIQQGIYWDSKIDSGIFLYSDNSDQKAIALSTGPEIIIGSFKKKMMDYTNLDMKFIYTYKEGASPFIFDDVDATQRLKFDYEQQIYGPLLFSLETYLNLDNGSDDYGKLIQSKYALDLRRRSYSLQLYYNPDPELVGFNFKIFNFDFDGDGTKF